MTDVQPAVEAAASHASAHRAQLQALSEKIQVGLGAAVLAAVTAYDELTVTLDSGNGSRG